MYSTVLVLVVACLSPPPPFHPLSLFLSWLWRQLPPGALVFNFTAHPMNNPTRIHSLNKNLARSNQVFPLDSPLSIRLAVSFTFKQKYTQKKIHSCLDVTLYTTSKKNTMLFVTIMAVSFPSLSRALLLKKKQSQNSDVFSFHCINVLKRTFFIALEITTLLN